MDGIIIFLAIAIIVYLVIRRKKKSHTEDKQTPQAAVKVYVVGRGRSYHWYFACPHINGKRTRKIDKAKAKAAGMKPCKVCYPYGD